MHSFFGNHGVTLLQFRTMSKKAPNCKPKSTRLVKDKPIALRLTKDELTVHDRKSRFLGFSASDLARRAYRAGLPLVLKELASPPAASAPAGVASSGATPAFSAR